MRHNNILWLSAALICSLSACEEDPEGTSVGSDSKPNVLIYDYAYSDETRPDVSDNNFNVRFVANSKTNEAYYSVIKAADYASLASDEAKLTDYVLSNGQRIEGLSVDNAVEQVIEIPGVNYICVVAKSGSAQHLSVHEVTGLEWVDICSGTYEFGVTGRRYEDLDPVETTLQNCASDQTLYRFKNLFGDGVSLKFSVLDTDEEHPDGYTYVRVVDQPALQSMRTDTISGEPLLFSVRDIAEWQNNIVYATYDGYCSVITPDNECEFTLQYHDAYGTLGFDYDVFTPQ